MSELDTVFQALGDERRRNVIVCLQEHQMVSLADLAEFVAEEECQQDIPAVSPETVRSVYFSLYHNHIPKLEEADLVDYEQESDVVLWTEDAQSSLSEAREFFTRLSRVA